MAPPRQGKPTHVDRLCRWARQHEFEGEHVSAAYGNSGRAALSKGLEQHRFRKVRDGVFVERMWRATADVTPEVDDRTETSARVLVRFRTGVVRTGWFCAWTGWTWLDDRGAPDQEGDDPIEWSDR